MIPFPRAVLFDVYRTLLEVGEAPSDSESRWQELCRSRFGKSTYPSLAEIDAACREVVAQDHAAAHAIGIRFPEVDWTSVFQRAFPASGVLSLALMEEFLYAHAALTRSVRLMPGAADVLRRCLVSGALCGIASNAQAYTLRELADALAPENLDPSLFDARLTFWSFDNGFSKPDPLVFRILAARLAGLGIPPHQALMVGDREDNDILPAIANGFRTFHFTPPPTGCAWQDFPHGKC